MRRCKMYWSLLVRHRHTDSRRKPRPHKVGFHYEKGCPDQTGSLLKPKVSWTPVTRNMHLSAGTTEPLLHAFLPPLHTTPQEQTPLTRKEAKKSKFPTDLWPGGDQRRAALHAYRGGSNRVYDCIISPLPHHLSTHRWTLQTTTPEQTDQASLIHLPPRCLCQVIAGGKRKTDQYISHGSDR